MGWHVRRCLCARQFRAVRPAGRCSTPQNPPPFIHQVCGPVRGGSVRGTARQRHFRGLLLLSGAQGSAHPHPARAGGSSGGSAGAVHPGDRTTARLDDAVAVVGQLARSSASSMPSACCARCRRLRNWPNSMPRAQSACACRAWRQTWSAAAPLHRTAVHRGRGAQGLLRAGVFPSRIRTVYDAVSHRHPPRFRCERRRGQSQAHLGRGLADQGRCAWSCLRGRRAGTADRASGHQPGVAQYRHVAARAGAGGRDTAAGTAAEPVQVAQNLQGHRC